MAVVDSGAPTLTAQNQTVEIGSSKNHVPTIGSLRSGENYTVTVDAVSTGAPSVVWDSVNSRFSINATSASLGSYTITGTITDTNNNSNTWSFTVAVVDSGAPTLTAQNQIVGRGLSKTHTPTIGNRRSGEVITVTVSSVTPSISGGPSVTWNSTHERFDFNTGDKNRNFHC